MVGTTIEDIDIKDKDMYKFENNKEACGIVDYRIDQVKDNDGN